MTKISVEYGRPAVGRKVFGELVPFGQVWRAGANEATKITFGQEVLFGGQKSEKRNLRIVCSSSRKRMENHFKQRVNNWGAYTYDAKEM